MRGMGEWVSGRSGRRPSAAVGGACCAASGMRRAMTMPRGHSSGKSRRPNRCAFDDDPCDRGPEVDFLGAQTDRPIRHIALQVGSRVCATRQLELIRQMQHRLDATLWT
jgi:hypothetical protein